jgi:hypothetical protein
MPGNGSRPEIKEGDGTEVGDGGGSYLATRRGAEGKGYSATQYCNLVSPEGGYVESFNGKLRDELLNGEIFTTLQEAKVLTAWWRRQYNHIRPHSALGYRPPAPIVIKSPIAAAS